MKAHSVLIVGGAHSGKTVYASQLYGRLASGESGVSLRKQPDDLSLFAVGYRRLSAGLAPEHTESTARDDVTLALVDAQGHPFDVVYPDYGGEQVDNMIDDREVPDEWAERIRSSATWLFFVRLDHQSDPQDVVSSPPGPAAPESESDSGDDSQNVGATPSIGSPSSEASQQEVGDAESGSGTAEVDDGEEDARDRPRELADQARTVEALQLLLHVYGASTSRRLTVPPLLVVLSCWDEVAGVETGTPPPAVLADRLPLVAAFVRANWDAESVAVYGLSAQGKAFEEGRPDDDFIDQGPEAMGYVVQPDGSNNPDLTVLLADALRRAPATDR